MGAGGAVQGTDRCRAGRPGQCRGAQGIRIHLGLLANYKREGETLSLRALSFDDASGAYGAYTYYRQNGWPKEAIGTGAASDHNRVLFWTGHDGGGCDLFAHRAHVGRRAARDRAPVARAQRKPRAGAAHSGQPAQGLARRADHALRGGAGGLRGSWRRAAAVAGGLRQGRRDGDRQLLAGFGPGDAHHHRLPHAADRRRRRKTRFAPI